jgi:hypothetical protein
MLAKFWQKFKNWQHILASIQENKTESYRVNSDLCIIFYGRILRSIVTPDKINNFHHV